MELFFILLTGFSFRLERRIVNQDGTFHYYYLFLDYVRHCRCGSCR